MTERISGELDRFITALWLERGLSDNTCQAYRRDISGFERWLLERKAQSVLAVDDGQIQSYLGARLSDGYSHRSIARLLSSLRAFYQYLVREGDIALDPTQHLERPKPSRPLPKSLSEAEVEALLEAPNPELPLEHRDLAMLEVLYASGLRVSELIELTMPQISLNQGVVRVIGKGSKERLVPIGEAAIARLRDYFAVARPEL